MQEYQAFPVDRRLEIINLARQPGAVASQSSTYGYEEGDILDAGIPVASRAIDGNTNGDYYNNSTSHTTYETAPWWKVDLLGEDVISSPFYAITNVKVYNRADSNQQRILNSKVQLQDTNGNILSEQTIPSEVKNVYDLDFGTFVGQVRYVKVQKLAADPPVPLHLAEVEVYGQEVAAPTESVSYKEQCRFEKPSLLLF